MCEATAEQGAPPGRQQQQGQPHGSGGAACLNPPGPSSRTAVPREELTPRELALLARVDSLLFGVVRMQLAENQEKKALLEKGVRALEQVIIDVRKGKARRRRRKRRYNQAAYGSPDIDDVTSSNTRIASKNVTLNGTIQDCEGVASSARKQAGCVGGSGNADDGEKGSEGQRILKNDGGLVEVKEEMMDVDEEMSTPRVNGHDNGEFEDCREGRTTAAVVDEEVAQLTAEVRVNGSCSPDNCSGDGRRNRCPGTSVESSVNDFDDSESQRQTSSPEDSEALTEIPVELWAKLGHLNLLLEDYEKALSAYQQYFQRRVDSWNNLSFMYGLAMVYYHYSQFEWAIRAFREILYLEPAFCRAAEVHARLGLMYKVRGDFTEAQRCLDHVARAIQNGEKLSISSFELQFHQAHLCEVQGKLRQAKEQYESLLENPALPRGVKAEVLRQLGWMYHSQPMESLGLPLRGIALPPLPPQQQRQSLAIQCLQKSIECDPTSGQSLYFLGRCFAAVGKVHDAFLSYRNSVDKAEANADTWCSIGILYQQQSQPMDALQAYICAVHLDKLHSPAWLNLGVLYEAVKQPADALKCYSHALHGSLFSPDSNLNTCQMP